MLAAIREYIFWWHFPPFLLLAAGWIFGGGYLLRRNCLNNDYNERKIRLGRACLITMLAEAAAIFAGGVIFFLFYSIATATKVRLVYVGVALGAVVSIVAVYLIFYVMLELPAKKVLKISLKPLAAVYAFSAVIIVISAWPAIAIHKTKVQKNICAMHIREISNALVNYEKGFGRPAPSL